MKDSGGNAMDSILVAGGIKWVRRPLYALTLLALLAVLALPQMTAAQEPTGPAAEVKALMDQAKKAGAKGQLPLTWWDLDSRYKTCMETGCGPEQWQQLEIDAAKLLNQAIFIGEMRQKKSAVEALLGRFDQALAEIAALYGVAMNPRLTGSDAAADLLVELDQRNLQTQVLIDSLTIANRHLNQTVGGQAVAQDSIITKLTIEVSTLRQRLWETELRVGVAEADRSAAETVLSKKQQREAAISSIRSSIGQDAGEVLLTPEGDVLLRITGIAFGVGSSQLKAGQEAVVAKISDAVKLFPGSKVAVAGHTDDTGSRDANLRLSRRRAETVARLMENQLGLAEGGIATEGFGPDRPVALNNTAEGRAFNRRIDVVISPLQ